MRDSLEMLKKNELIKIIDNVYKDNQPIELQSYKNFNLVFSKKILDSKVCCWYLIHTVRAEITK